MSARAGVSLRWCMFARAHDARRQRILESLGYRVVHIDAELVERDVRAAVEIVRRAVE